MQFVERVGRVFVSVSEFYRDINPSTLTGAIDVIVVEDASGHFSCSPFHVRFGKLQVLLPQDKIVDVSVNGSPPLKSISMKVGEAGECFFVVESLDPVPEEYATSPLIHSQKPSPDLLSNLTNLSLGDRAVIPSTITYPLSDSEVDYTSSVGITPSSREKQVENKDTNEDRHNDDQDDDLIIMRGHSLSDSEIYDYSTSIAGLRSNANQERQSSSFWSWGWGKLPKQKKPTTINDDGAQVLPPTPGEMNFLSSPSSCTSTCASNTNLILGLNESGTSPVKELHGSSLPLDCPPEASFDPSFSTQTPILNQNTVLNAKEGNDEAIRPSEDITLLVQDMLSIKIESTRSVIEACELSEDFVVPGSIVGNGVTATIVENKKACPNIRALDDSCLQQSTSALSMKTSTPNGWQFWWKKNSSSSATSLISQSTGMKNESKSSIFTGTLNIEKMNDQSKTLLSRDTPKSSPSASERSIESKTSAKEKFFYYKSLRLSSEQLRLLNLKRGSNTVTFSTSRGATCSSRIFYWSSDCKIVISDVDGTITKSDVLGHLYTMVGKDWTHSGVARLYSSIKSNGYEILYLTSRAIGQADYTRIYLKNIEQESFSLPDGPVIMSPDRLLAAFHREVILKRPDEFKVACLKDIRRLFENSGNSLPFYAGFGNRPTDAISYLSVGIPSSRIFIINSSGEVRLQNLGAVYQSSYSEMDKLVGHFFPPISNIVNQVPSRNSYAALLYDQWSDYHYWGNSPILLDDNPTLTTKTPPSPIGSINEKRVETSTRSPKKNERHFLSIDTSSTSLESPFIDKSIVSSSLSQSSLLEWNQNTQVAAGQESEGEEAEEHPYF